MTLLVTKGYYVPSNRRKKIETKEDQNAVEKIQRTTKSIIYDTNMNIFGKELLPGGDLSRFCDEKFRIGSMYEEFY